MRKLTPIRSRKPSEQGYTLVLVMFLLALVLLALTVATPVIRKQIQRDTEIETMHRGDQYARAVRLYYKQFGAYPPTVDALVNTNQIKFLRKKYIDPTTGKDEWKIIRFGQQKTQPMGFFGQPLAGAGMQAAGTGPAGGGSSFGGSSQTANGSGTSGGLFGGGFGSGAGNGNASGSSSIFSSSDSATSSGAGTTAASGTTAAGTSSPTGSTGTGSDSTSTGQSAGSQSSVSGSTTSSSASTGLSGQTFGGLGIIGFSPNSPKQSILVYKKKNHYNEWEFIYDPLADMMMTGGNTGAIGQPASNATTPIGSQSTFGQNAPTNGAPPPQQGPNQNNPVNNPPTQ